MRAVAFCVLLFGLLGSGLTWYAGYTRHAAERAKVAGLAADLAASLFHPERQREALQRYDSYGTAGPESAIYFTWAHTTVAAGAWLGCAAVWLAITGVAWPGRFGRAARWGVIGGMTLGAVFAGLFPLGDDYDPAGPPLSRLRGAWYGAAFGSWAGTLWGGLLGYSTMSKRSHGPTTRENETPETA